MTPATLESPLYLRLPQESGQVPGTRPSAQHDGVIPRSHVADAHDLATLKPQGDGSLKAHGQPRDIAFDGRLKV